MKYQFAYDLKAIREILDLSQKEIAEELGTEQAIISRNESGIYEPLASTMETAYQFAYQKGIRINILKEMLHRETIAPKHLLLFHGAKDELNGSISLYMSKPSNDFGSGFYAGDNYEQAVSFVSGYKRSCVYLLDLDICGLKIRKYGVDRDWMMTIAYYRGLLDRYKDHPIIKKLIVLSRECDVIQAPIADNRMFQIIDSFINGEITDEQCKHCLAATNLGYQYVFVSEKALLNMQIIERCYLCEDEKKDYRNKRLLDSKTGGDKVRLARIEYRGKGRYIDEILSKQEEKNEKDR